MKYRLKDRELQQKLDDISDGAFSKALDISTQRLIDVYKQDGLDFNLDTDRVFVDFGNDVKVCTQQKQFRACFEPGTIEERKEYNPKAWNKFPEVEPPEGVLMRVEWRDGAVVRRDVARYVACSDVDEFVWFNKSVICDVERFRPWDEEDEA